MKTWKIWPKDDFKFDWGLGLFKDVKEKDIPIGGFLTCDQFHVVDNALEKYLGWAAYQAIDVTYPITYLSMFEKLDAATRYILIGHKKNLYVYDAVNLEADALNVSDFNAGTSDRWQSADLNNKRYFVSGQDPIQVYDGSTLAAVGGTDALKPAKSRFIVTFVNRLIVGNTYTGSDWYRTRIQGCDTNDPEVWTPATNKEAFWQDIDEGYGDLRGMALLGPMQLIIYFRRAVYLLNYVGLPEIYTLTRKVSDEGLEFPYSLVTQADRHFGISKRGFFMFDGSQIHDIGKDKIFNYWVQDILQGDSSAVYGFAHPIYPEIWWVYADKTQNNLVYTKCIIYNWQTGGWCTRDSFNQSALCGAIDPEVHSISGLTGTFQDATLTWYEKRKTSGLVIFSGDNNGHLYLHGFSDQAAGSDLTGRLETGWIIPAGHTQNTFVNELLFQLDRITAGSEVKISLASKKELVDTFTYGTYTDLSVLSDKISALRATGKYFKLLIETTGRIRLHWFGMTHRQIGTR